MGLSTDVVKSHIDQWEDRLSRGKGRYRENWPSRLFRHEPLENAVEILKSGALLSRRDAEGEIARDIAPADIIGSRRAAHDSVRLYFRPKSPTQYHIESIRKPRDLYHGRQAPVLVLKELGAATSYAGFHLGELVERVRAHPRGPDVLVLDGELTDRELAGVYTACDLLVHPYRGEGFGMPVLEARACGLPLTSILFKHMLPNGVGPVLVDASFGVAAAIFIETNLSFLGFGIKPPDPSWGQMLSAAIDPSTGVFRWWLAIFPGVMIFLTVFCYNLLGDALRDAIDPYTKREAHL